MRPLICPVCGAQVWWSCSAGPGGYGRVSCIKAPNSPTLAQPGLCSWKGQPLIRVDGVVRVG